MSKIAKIQKILFSIGSIALALAVLSVTILPFLVNHFMMGTYIPVLYFKIISGIFYFVALLAYVFSSRYSNMQINWILITFAYFILFQILAKMMS